MKILNYNIVLRPEPEGGYTVFVPSLPGCITYGKNLEKAREMAEDAIKLYIEVLQEDGEPIPSDEENVSASVRVAMPVRSHSHTRARGRVYA